MEEPLLILFFLLLVLVFAGAALAYLRLLRAETRKERESQLASLKELREQLLQLEQRFRELQSRLAPSFVERPSSAQGDGNNEALIDAELRRRGFSKIRVLPPLPGAAPGEVPVEAMKDQMDYKGRVLVRDGVVVECRLQPSYEVFP